MTFSFLYIYLFVYVQKFLFEHFKESTDSILIKLSHGNLIEWSILQYELLTIKFSAPRYIWSLNPWVPHTLIFQTESHFIYCFASPHARRRNLLEVIRSPEISPTFFMSLSVSRCDASIFLFYIFLKDEAHSVTLLVFNLLPNPQTIATSIVDLYVDPLLAFWLRDQKWLIRIRYGS